MTEIYIDTRDMAREWFKNSGLNYSDIKEKDFYLLLALLADELELFSETHKDENVHGIATMRISDRTGLKRYLPIYNKKENGEMENAYIFVDSHYFQGREAISFNRDGFVGFAGWADSTNVLPFIRAFVRFVDYLKERKGGAE